MKISKLKAAIKPFVDTEKVTITACWDSKMIGEFKVKLEGKPEKTFPIKGNPLEAFKKVEKYVGNIS